MSWNPPIADGVLNCLDATMPAGPVTKTMSQNRALTLLDEGLSPFIQALLTDMYQLTMCYAYWKSGKHQQEAVFDLFFRKNPFKGEYTIFCGLEECLRFLENFRFTSSDLAYLRQVFPPTAEAEFFEYLAGVDGRDVTLWAIPEGTVVFPKVPLITIQGPLAVCQLLETTLLNLVNYASLVGTNAARFRVAAGPTATLLEFGLRRAQGPNGGLCASKYCYIGGFDGTSNLLAGKLYGIPVRGTMAHSFISAFSSQADLNVRHLEPEVKSPNAKLDFYQLSSGYLDKIVQLVPVVREEVSEGELVAFCAYAIAFPHAFLALIDTYDVIRSGVLNFCACALSLWDLGYRALGVRIDSGDLAYLSQETRRTLKLIAQHFKVGWLGETTIVASNDLNEDTLYSLNEQRHEIDSFGVGTHLVTCQKQPALGCVFKLVSVSGHPTIKLSQEVEKISIPGRKQAYRLYGKHGRAINDLMLVHTEPAPKPGKAILCRHPFQENKRAFVTPNEVEPLHVVHWSEGRIQQRIPTMAELKERVEVSMNTVREDIKRNLNPTPYKVSLSEQLYDFLHSMWLKNAPIGQLE